MRSPRPYNRHFNFRALRGRKQFLLQIRHSALLQKFVRLLLYRFLLPAGWLNEANKELEKIIDAFPAQRARLQTMQDALTKLQTIQFADELERDSSDEGRVIAAEYHPGQGRAGGCTHARLQNLDTHTFWEHSFRAELRFHNWCSAISSIK